MAQRPDFRYNFTPMFMIVDKIDTAAEKKERCTLIDKMGRYFHGVITDTWVRASGGKMRGKIRFLSDEKGEIEMDVNDILDLLPLPPSAVTTGNPSDKS